MRERIKSNKQAREELAVLSKRKRDLRFQQLLDLANDGDAEAVGDLFREFKHVFQTEGDGHDAD